MSDDTISSSVYTSTLASGPEPAAALNASLISSTVTSRPRMPVKSVIEPSCTGTRSELPSSLLFIDSSTRLVARAAPVDDGTMLTADARARRMSLWARSSRFWSFVYAWTVVIRPFSTPNASSRTLIIGTKQFVVHDAFETIVIDGLNWSSLRPTTNGAWTLVAGALMS